jgi:GH15 family glucan-1,4-alpha-glucosidase
MYPYSLIGNCQSAALVSNLGSIDWLCLPRPDSPPVFGRLLDPEGGSFSMEYKSNATGRQQYVSNTNVLITTVRQADESEIEITDFFPRLSIDGKMYRPTSLFRIISPKSGAPHVTIKCRPVDGWKKTPVKPVLGEKELKYELSQGHLYLATNMSFTLLSEESAFTLTEPLYFALSYGSPIEGNLTSITHHYLTETLDYWRNWVMECSIPTLYQKETIRSALALKLHCYEDTGAILAGLTTSLPEEPGNTRNWDYRFCWLRDAFFFLSAYYHLGHFSELEGFLKFLLNIAHYHEHSTDRLRPVYALDQSLPLPENIHENWAGYMGSRPVRSNNQAAEHVQNDVYGEMILTLSPIYFDERFEHLRTVEHENLLIHLAESCDDNIGRSDAGLWELRDGWQLHAFSELMGWAGIQKMIQIQERGYLRGMKLDLKASRKKAVRALELSRVDGYLRNGPKDDSLNAALLLLPLLGYPDAELCRKTVYAIEEQLRLGSDDFTRYFLYRYHRPDDFGRPKSAFLICSFWLVEALARIGHVDRARAAMDQILKAGNEVGLFSEHFLPESREQFGNFPQAYSHVGLINAAFAISPSWTEYFLAG